MKPTFTRRATQEDALSVASRLREEDIQEVLAGAGVDPRLLLPSYIAEGREVYAAGLAEDLRAEVLYGIDPVNGAPDTAVIWMLTTPRIFEHPVEYLIPIKHGVDYFHTRYNILTNFVDERNERHIRWMRWLKFVFFRRIDKFGARSLPFLEFASVRLPPCA